MNGILSIGAAGLRTTLAELHGSAARVARAGLSPESSLEADLAAEAVTQIRARHEFAAQAQVVQTANEMLGTLIDTFA